MKRYLLFISFLTVAMVLLQLLTGWLLTISYEPEIFGRSRLNTMNGSTYHTYVNILIASTIAFFISTRLFEKTKE